MLPTSDSGYKKRSRATTSEYVSFIDEGVGAENYEDSSLSDEDLDLHPDEEKTYGQLSVKLVKLSCPLVLNELLQNPKSLACW